MARHLHIDPFAGIAGDMFLGSCIDLGAPLGEIEAALRPLPIELPYSLTIAETFRHNIRGIDFKVAMGNAESDVRNRKPGGADPHHSHDHNHPHGHSHDHSRSGVSHSEFRISHSHSHAGYSQIMSMIDQLHAPERAKARARAITTAIGRAEAHVHGIPLEAVHFHEVGAVDSIVDMLGATVALELLDVQTISSGSLPIGHGFVRCAHGVMPLPAPATAEILKAVPHHGVHREGETVTPTGAAIVAALATEFGPMPPMRVEAVGYGAGDRDLPDVPNLLRLFLGTRLVNGQM